MGTLGYRILVLFWFLAYMAVVYLALHVVIARLARRPESRLLWFFGIVTDPLTRPVRAVLPAGASASRVRLAALGVYVALWLALRFWLARLGGIVLG